MFGTLRTLAQKAKSLFTKAKTAPKTTRYTGPPVRVETGSQRLLALASAMSVMRRADHPHHYPELSCRSGRKTKGRRDRSLKMRSNRRKVAR
jgi:hypothetical protein